MRLLSCVAAAGDLLVVRSLDYGLFRLVCYVHFYCGNKIILKS
jgi:hypothetical protein